MSAVKITDKLAARMMTGETLADSVITGLQLRAEKHAKTWKLRYRLGDARLTMRLGAWPVMTVDDAREEATRALRRVQKGEDPTRPEITTHTVAALVPQFFIDYANPRFGTKSMKMAHLCFDRYIVPWFGNRRAADLNMLEINEKLQELSKTAPYLANRVRDHIGLFLSQCEKWGVRPLNSNPQKHLHRNPEKPHRTEMSAEVMARVFAAIDAEEAENPASESACLCIRLIALTGCRRDEIRTVRRADVHLECDEPYIFLPKTKSGRKAHGTTGERKLPLGPEAIEIIRRSYERKPFSQWLVPGVFTTGPLDDPSVCWRRIRKRAGLSTGFRLHDLRHWYVSYLLSQGFTAEEIAPLVGHKDATVTRRVYADMLVEDVGVKHREAQHAMARMMMGVGK
jgi:integrase